MSRLPLLPLPEESSLEAAHPIGQARNLHRILAYNPALLRSWKLFTSSLRGDCQSPRDLRELCTLRVAMFGRSDYMWQEHRVAAKKSGLSDEKIDGLAIWQTSPVFSEKERVALALTEAVVGSYVTDELFQRALATFSAAEVMELILTAAFYGMVPQFTFAMDIPAE